MRVFRHLEPASPATSAIRDPEIDQSCAPSASKTQQLAQSPPRGIARVPTHTVGRARERRAYARARMALRICSLRVAGRHECKAAPLETRNISSTGLFFLAPFHVEPGTPIELEVVLVSPPFGRAFGRGAVYMRAVAHVVRAENIEQPGWYGLAAAFDDVNYRRDDRLPAHSGDD
jgi:hypothetical protein